MPARNPTTAPRTRCRARRRPERSTRRGRRGRPPRRARRSRLACRSAGSGPRQVRRGRPPRRVPEGRSISIPSAKSHTQAATTPPGRRTCASRAAACRRVGHEVQHELGQGGVELGRRRTGAASARPGVTSTPGCAAAALGRERGRRVDTPTRRAPPRRSASTPVRAPGPHPTSSTRWPAATPAASANGTASGARVPAHEPVVGLAGRRNDRAPSAVPFGSVAVIEPLWQTGIGSPAPGAGPALERADDPAVIQPP